MQPEFQINIWGIFLQSLLIFLKLWPLWLLLLFVLSIGIILNKLELEFDNWAIRRKFRNGEKWRSGRDLIHWLQDMKPSEFEDYISHLFTNLGFRTRVVGGAYDGGIDVIAEKNGIEHFIQCKKFITRQVPVGAVRDFYGAIANKGARAKGYIITTNKFTLEAEKFAETTPIELIDGSTLVKYVEMAKMDNSVVSKSLKPEIQCPICGNKMIKKNGKYGEFYGCTRYPECRGTQKI